MSAPETIAHLLSTRSTLRRLGRYEITDDPDRIDVDTVHRYLSRESYWRRGVTRDRVERSLQMSLPIAAVEMGEQPRTVGCMRVITDSLTHAWFDDLFVLPDHQGHGLGRAMMQAGLAHPAVADASMQLLFTADAHAFYAQDGFQSFPDPRVLMVRWAR
jgi:GNAT superfamily N-acetyltransferase